MKKSVKRIIGAVIAILLISVAGKIYGSVIEYAEIGYTSAYLIDMASRASIYIAVFVIFAAVMLVNYSVVRRTLTKMGEMDTLYRHSGKVIALTFAVALVCAVAIGNLNYETVLLYLNKVPFKEVDSIFRKDISFYFFSLPFYKLILSVLDAAFVAGIVYTAVLYFVFSLRGDVRSALSKEGLITHIASDILIFVAVKSASIYLKGYDLLYGTFSSDINGAGMTAVKCWKLFYATVPLMIFIAAVFAIIFLAKGRKKQFVVSIAIVPALCVIFLVFTGIYQGLYVNPREVTAEAPYIGHNIEATKKAYGIDEIEERIFDIDYTLTAQDIKNNPGIVENIRITDNTANLTVANTLQATRGYYDFKDMDILPYDVNGQMRGLSTAVREINPDKLDESSRSYINEKMRYTHGYGLVMSYINSVSVEGQPNYIVKDVPIKESEGAPKINVPQIYYGELTNSYAIVGTDYNELDYMKDGESIETRYEGEGGVKLSLLNRLYYCVSKGDWMMLFSGYINSDSKVLVNRNIIERAKKIAPYLLYDSDPYMIVTNDGRLKWVIDAYTVSEKYPYSQNYSGINYIRNSAKVIVDAYDGTTEFYITDESDPLIAAYSKIYKDVFMDERLPEDISTHIRYPEFLFKIQMSMYERYHVTDPETFYSKSDLWLTAKEKYNNSTEKDVDPYYNVMRLTEEADEDMVLMLPFIPSAKQNLIAWVGASSNYDTYGKMVVYKFPEGSPVNGTLQIENMISADPVISEQITLWDQGDSNVIKGNLLVIPIENSILYVEPLYITSGETSSIPQVKRIIVAYGDKIAMEDTLEKALVKLFGGTEEQIQSVPQVELPENISEIRQIFDEVKRAMESGNWADFGSGMDKLEKAIK